MADERLVAARVAALFDVSRPAYYATVANAGLLLLVLWEAFPEALLLAWFGTLVALTFIRVGLHRRQARAGNPDPRRREAYFALGAFAAGALWSFPAAVFFPADDEDDRQLQQQDLRRQTREPSRLRDERHGCAIVTSSGPARESQK